MVYSKVLQHVAVSMMKDGDHESIQSLFLWRCIAWILGVNGYLWITQWIKSSTALMSYVGCFLDCTVEVVGFQCERKWRYLLTVKVKFWCQIFKKEEEYCQAEVFLKHLSKQNWEKKKVKIKIKWKKTLYYCIRYAISDNTLYIKRSSTYLLQ